MPIGAAIVAAGAIGAGASIFGSMTQKSSADAARNQQMQLFQMISGQAQPFIKAGQTAATSLKDLLTPGSDMTSWLSSVPGYQFMQDWGQKAVKNIGSMRGLGGNVGKGLSDFSTGTALSSSFNPIVQALQGLMGGGNQALGALGGAAGTASTNVGNSMMAGGNAIAGGAMGAANSITGALGAGTNYSMLQQLIQGGKGGGGAWGGDSPLNSAGAPMPWAMA